MVTGRASIDSLGPPPNAIDDAREEKEHIQDYFYPPTAWRPHVDLFSGEAIRADDFFIVWFGVSGDPPQENEDGSNPEPRYRVHRGVHGSSSSSLNGASFGSNVCGSMP